MVKLFVGLKNNRTPTSDNEKKVFRVVLQVGNVGGGGELKVLDFETKN